MTLATLLRSLSMVIFLVLGVAPGASALASSAATPAATPVASRVLRFDVRFHDTILAADPTKLQLGDRFILSDKLLHAGKEVGHNAGVCTLTDTAGEMVCTVTYWFADGTISTQFINSPPPKKEFAVTGGTGAYANARGTGELNEHGDETGDITFWLVD